MLLGLSPAREIKAKPVTVDDLLAGAPAADWRTPNANDTVYLELPQGRVVIELATQVVPQHAANIKALARAHYFDGLAIIRVQDNYGVQWDDESHRRALPTSVQPSVEFTAEAKAAARFQPLPDHDLYAGQVGFLDGFPAARDPATKSVWLAHCYGMVGAGRMAEPEEIADVVYFVSSPTPIVSMRVAADVPAAERTQIEVLRTDSTTFRALLDQRRDRHEPWFKHNPGVIDLCNVPLPVRSPGGH